MTSKPITGSINIQMSDAFVNPPKASDAYLGVARELMPGILYLRNGGPGTAGALALAAAHALECTLKAYV